MNPITQYLDVAELPIVLRAITTDRDTGKRRLKMRFDEVANLVEYLHSGTEPVMRPTTKAIEDPSQIDKNDLIFDAPEVEYDEYKSKALITYIERQKKWEKDPRANPEDLPIAITPYWKRVHSISDPRIVCYTDYLALHGEKRRLVLLREVSSMDPKLTERDYRLITAYLLVLYDHGIKEVDYVRYTTENNLPLAVLKLTGDRGEKIGALFEEFLDLVEQE